MGARRRRQNQRHGERLMVVAVVAAGALMLLAVALVLPAHRALDAVAGDLPQLDVTATAPTVENTYIYDGSPEPRLLAVLHGDESRVIVAADQIAPVLKQAVIAIEDERFYAHRGVDYLAIGRAFIADVSAGATVQGGSTITQQLIKNTAIDAREKTQQSLSRKVREAALAFQLEKQWSKAKILTNYLNTIYFGQSAYGVEMAARTFFGTSARRLSLAQAALLAGVIRSPNSANPFDHPGAARRRRALVLDAMVAQGHVTRERAAAAAAAPLPKHPHATPKSKLAPYFVEYVIQQLVREFGPTRAFGGGLRVYTTLDPKMQRDANAVSRAILARPDDPTVSIVALDPRDGEVKAMVGGRDFDRQQFNVAVQGRRQPGSAFKPFALAAAIKQGLSPASVFISEPKSIQLEGELWNVATYSGSYLGPVTLREATVFSDNTVYADLAMMTDPGEIAAMAQRLGIASNVGTNPSIALGGLEEGVSPLDMAAAYATFAAGGERTTGAVSLTGQPTPISIRKVTDASGRVLLNNRPVRDVAMDPWEAGLVTDILREVVSRGTGTAAALGRPCAGKTGTTQDFADAWFVGYTPDLVASVWVGYPNARRPLFVRGINVAGGTFPATIWRAFMTRALAGVPAHDFPSFTTPPVEKAVVCTRTGDIATRWCPERIKAFFFAGRTPPSTCAFHGPANVVVPDVTGASLATAQAALRKLLLEAEVTFVPSEPAQQGLVLDQNPGAGATALQGSRVTLRVGSGPLKMVPDVVGMLAADAQALLEGAGFSCLVEYTSGDGSPNTVISQWPDAGTAAQGEVTIYVAEGDGQVAVPDVRGLTLGAAEATLAEAGLTATAEGSTAAEAVVAAQRPRAGAPVMPGSVVTLTMR